MTIANSVTRPPLLLVPGIDGTGRLFYRQVPHLERRFSVTATRLRDDAASMRELVTDPGRLPHTPQHVLWLSSGSLNEGTGRFVLFTQDANRVTFDYRTGEVLSRGQAGLRNPLLTTVLVASGALAAVVLGVWAYLAFVRWRRPALTPSSPP